MPLDYSPVTSSSVFLLNWSVSLIQLHTDLLAKQRLGLQLNRKKKQKQKTNQHKKEENIFRNMFEILYQLLCLNTAAKRIY